MESASKFISLLTAYLLALGYINNYGFYYHFGIEIFTYLNATEIILSFLPMIIPILISILIIIYFSLMIDRQYESEKKRNPVITNKDLTFWGPFRDLLKLCKNKFRTEEKVGDLIFHYFVHIINRLIHLFLIAGMTYVYIYAFVKKQGFPYDSPIFFFFFSLIWLFIITYHAKKYFDLSLKEISTKMTLVVFLLGFLGSIYLYNSFKAYRILEGKPLYSVELSSNGNVVKTDEMFVYVGKTKEYYFFRNLESNENVIIKESSIDKAKILKIITD